MASTGKTTNYELSQFIGTDKPSWLGDYNGDMLKIDTALGSINATATTAQSGVASAQSAASAAQQTANAAQQKATANAQNITELKADLNFSLLNTSPLNSANSGMSVIKSSNIVIFKGALYAQEKPSNTTLLNTTYLWPFQSVTGNLFNILASTLTDSSNKFYLGNPICSISSSGSTTIVIPTLLAYFDGASTVFYMSFSQQDWTNIDSFNAIACNSTCGLTGSLISI